MSHTEANDADNMDISLSPGTSTQYPENISPSSSCVKMMYSKIISSCQRSNRMTSVVTPENKEDCKSPFIRKKVPFNPFNRNLKERLGNPIFSPDVFSTVISPSQVLFLIIDEFANCYGRCIVIFYILGFERIQVDYR